MSYLDIVDIVSIEIPIDVHCNLIGIYCIIKILISC